jgi:predicted metal-dependent enzyme (double-stranded beta helix superfamily)
MSNDRLSIAAAWGQQLSAALLGLSSEVTPSEIQSLRASLSELAWRTGCPTAHRARSDSELAYRRQLLVAAPDNSYSALLIMWPPGHQTPLHDHSEMWGIELVLDGALEVREFVNVESTPMDLQFNRSVILGCGDATTFIDRGYVHSCRNLSATKPALSLHVYGGMLDSYRAFQKDDRGIFHTVRNAAERI